MKYHAYLTLTFGIVLLSLATMAQAQVTLNAPSQAGINETIEIGFSGPLAGTDIIRFADMENNILGGSYTYPGNAKNGTVRLAVPVEPGEYQVVYLSNREIVASSRLTVVDVQAELSGPQRVGINESFEVEFSGPDNSGDLIKVVAPEGKSAVRIYAYTATAKDGRVSLKAPAEPGQYLLSYETGNKSIGQTEIEVFGVEASLSAPEEIQAGAYFTVVSDGPNNSGDMVLVVDSEGKSMASYGYVVNNPEGVSLRAPETPGAYSVVYRTAGKDIGTTGILVTEVTASLEAQASEPGNQRFPVTWDGPGNSGDTIRLYPVGTNDDVAYRYITSDEGNTAMLLAPEQPGPHELRYITHGGQILATRNIEITPPVIKPGMLEVLARPGLELGNNDALEVVLDASGSMLQRQDGERRIEIAKRTLNALLSEIIPEGTPFAMRVFGHREADSCRTDLEIPLGPLNRNEALGKLNSVNAMNLAKTPIADSLARTESDLRRASGERIIVLITDGEETCDGDPSNVIAGMRARGQNIRFNIVGYAIDDAGLQDTFQRWATLGGGQYFNASDEAELASALINSVAPSFLVLDEDGTGVASGVAGGEPVQLSPGEYTVRVAGSDHPVRVQADSRTTLDLKVTAGS